MASQTNEEIYSIVKENLQTSESLSIDLSDICSKNEDVNSFFNHAITESLLSDKSDFFGDFKEGSDAVSYLTNKLTYNDEIYIPLAYVLEETREINWNTKPTIAVAEGILDDVIPAWNTKGEEILLSEKQALSTNLLIIVGNGEVGSTKKKANRTLGTEFAIASPRFDCSSCAQVRINEHQVKNGFFFDNSNKCVLRGHVFYYPGLGNITNNGPMQYFCPDISESDVSASKLFTTAQDGYDVNASDIQTNVNVFLAFYERDWYSSLKDIDKGICKI